MCCQLSPSLVDSVHPASKVGKEFQQDDSMISAGLTVSSDKDLILAAPTPTDDNSEESEPMISG